MTAIYGTKLNKLSSDYASLLGNIKTGMENATDVAVDLEESLFTLGQSAPEILNKLRDCMSEYQKMQLQLDAQRKCLDRLQLQVTVGGVGKDFYTTFQNKVNAEMEQYSQLTNSQKWAKFGYLKEFNTRIAEIRGDELENDGDDGDEDIQVVGHQVSLSCPFTLKRFVNPVKSIKCHHVYEKSAVMDIIKRNRGQIECPVTGCNHYLVAADLTSDQKMARKLERERKRESTQQSSSRQDYMILE